MRERRVGAEAGVPASPEADTGARGVAAEGRGGTGRGVGLGDEGRGEGEGIGGRTRRGRAGNSEEGGGGEEADAPRRGMRLHNLEVRQIRVGEISQSCKAIRGLGAGDPRAREARGLARHRGAGSRGRRRRTGRTRDRGRGRAGRNKRGVQRPEASICRSQVIRRTEGTV